MFAKKSLGQYFLRCNWVVSTLIKAAELNVNDMVLEVGPGTGILTRELAKNARQVIAVEKDEKLADKLVKTLGDQTPNVTVIRADIMDMLQAKLTSQRGKLSLQHALLQKKYKVVANIPYYLTSRLLRLLLENGPRPELIVLTIQKEVAQRICAKPPDMNLLALSVQIFGKPEIIKIVPASCFSPKPKVDSAIIKISEISDSFFRKNSISQDEFFGVIRRAFSQKRKMLTTSLAGILPKSYVESALAEAGAHNKARPEELGPEQWAKIVAGLSTSP